MGESPNTNPKRERVRSLPPSQTHSLALRVCMTIQQKRISVCSLMRTLIVLLMICLSPFAAAQSEPQWATDKAFGEARHRPFSISWQAAPLRDRLNELARQQGISIFLDRRVDPRTPISLDASNVTMEQLLLQLCDQQELGFCRIGDSFYLGTKPTAHRLLIISENPSKTSTVLLKKAAFNWPDLTTPEQALNGLIAEADLKLENADLLPHDLMASGNTPPMTLGRRLRLLLIQFDLDYELKRNSKTLSLRRAEDLPETGSVRFSDVDLSLAQYQAIKAKATDSRMRRRKSSITITGPIEELVMVRDFIVKSFSPPVGAAGDQQFTLKVTSRRLDVLAAVGKQLQMPLDTSSADPETMAEVVSLSVANVSLQELLDQIVAGSGATCIVADGKIVVENRKIDD